LNDRILAEQSGTNGTEDLESSFFLSDTGGMAYTQAQLETMLTTVQTAISKCITAQEYSSGAGISLKRAALDQLQKREQWLLGEIAKFGGVGSTFDPVNRVEFVEPL
jgi:hypothetical protein